MSGGGGQQSSSTQTKLPSWLVPYAQAFIGSYFNQAFGGPQSFQPPGKKGTGAPPPATGGPAMAGPSTIPGGDPMAQTGAATSAPPPVDTSGKNKGKNKGGPVMLGQGAPAPISMPTDMNQQVAGFTPDQLASMQNIESMTGGMQNVANAGLVNAGNTMAGGYLDPATNPWLRKTYDDAASAVTSNFSQATLPGIYAAAQRAGQFGSSAMNEVTGTAAQTLGKTLDSLATDIYGGNYQQERSRQLQAMGLLPQTLQAGYYPQNALGAVGAQQQEQQQTEFDTAYQNAVSNTQFPFTVLSGFGGALGQAAGGAGTSKTSMSGGGK